jgi:two-component system sensor histidine kinase KdpD
MIAAGVEPSLLGWHPDRMRQPSIPAAGAGGALPGRPGARRVHAAAAATWLVATVAAWLARDTGQPQSSALVYLFGIILIGAIEGVGGGIVAGIFASLFYNFFLTDPLFRFTFGSPDEFVPLIAFSSSAVAAGWIAGRLRDRALAAEAATRRLAALLDFRERLQDAAEAEQIPLALEAFPRLCPAELHIVRDGRLVPADPARAADAALAERAWRGGAERRDEGGRSAWPLASRTGVSGVLVTRRPAGAIASDAGGVVGLLALALERCLLRERLSEAELIRRSEALKTALLSSVSHDLRTPLGAISASASSLERYGTALGEETRADLLRLIRAQCERLDRYTTNLLNLGRIQAGLDASGFTRCDPMEVVGAALSSLRPGAGGREFRKDYGDSAGTLVRADPVMLEQVFLNILENALRYSPEGSPIRIHARKAGDRIHISVADCGPGIAAGDAGRVFDRFYRAETGKAGSGLGLPIARGFTEAFGGTIAVLRGEPPFGGAEIRISLPVEREAVAA